VRWQDAQRALWNAATAQRRIWRRGTFASQNRELTELRAEHGWIREVPTDLQQALLRSLDVSWQRFFKSLSRRPRFKSRTKGDWATMRTDAASRFEVRRKKVRLPKLGWVRLRSHRRTEGRPISIAITRDVDQWFVSVTCELTEAVPFHAHAESRVGIDVGICNVVTDSDGVRHANPRHLDKALELLSRAQRQMARKRKGSNRRKRAKMRAAKAHRRIRRQRADFLHNLSHSYTKSHGVIVVEALEVRSMSRSARGTVARPGTNVSQKTGLNRAILDAGWGELRRQLRYKAERAGGTVVEVPAAYTSQACSVCGHVSEDNRVTRAAFLCVACGHADHADVNAAKNILALGTSRTPGATPGAARGGCIRRPAKREGVVHVATSSLVL